jgi:LPS O-antigen subunit length determinant protein (WzzB/FepE family)
MMQPYPNQPYIEEDEIDLRELFSTIWGNKFKIIFLSMLITSLALIYALTKPNSYASQTILILKEQGKPTLGGGAAALASMAGINLGGSSASIDVGALFKNLINDYAFNKEVITRYNLAYKLSPEAMDKHMVYVLNGREMRADIAKFFSSEKEEKNKEEIIYDTFKDIKKIISTSTDKESGAITLSATLEDRFLAKELVNIYLKEMSDYIKRLDLKEIDEQVIYYENELASTTSLDLKQNITELLSALVKKKVLSQAGEFYMVKQLTKPEVAYIKDKTKPKRGLIIVVAFITSIILGIFMVFFGEFLKNSKERKSDLSF